MSREPRDRKMGIMRKAHGNWRQKNLMCGALVLAESPAYTGSRSLLTASFEQSGFLAMRQLCWAFVAFSFMAARLPAATVHITPSVAGLLNLDFTPVDPAGVFEPGIFAGQPGQSYLAQIEVDLRIDGLGGHAIGFSNTAFNVEISGVGRAYSDPDLGIPAWNADNPQIDINGPGPGGLVSKWDINSDDGADKNDLQAVILAGITKNFGPPAFDTRRTLGQDADGDHAGTFYVEFPCMPGSGASAEVLAAFGASTYDADGNSSTAGNEAVGGSTGLFGCITPEPSSWALMGLGSALLLGGVRRRS